jgi:osmotically inducible protein OsmC
MALIKRTATLTWEGTLARGAGSVRAHSGAFDALPVTDASRMTLEGETAKTSPEELIAGAHATCFAMALGAGLAGARTPPTRLEVEATWTLNATRGQFGIVAADLYVKGLVEGIDQDTFARHAADAGGNCVVSKAVAGNVEVSVRAELEAG